MIERVLVPIDGGALDAKAFAMSIALAHQLGAAITGFIVEPFNVAPTHRSDASLQAHAHGILDRFERLAREAGVPFERAVTQATVVTEAILAAAREHRCDMIVMATRGRGVVSELLWGSHTREVMSGTDLPVLVLH